MAEDRGGSLLFDGIASWLIGQGLREPDLGALVEGLGERLVTGGVPIHRISVGGMILHPVYGALDVTWQANGRIRRNEKIPRSLMASPQFQNSPFFKALANRTPFDRYRLDDPAQAAAFPILGTLRDQGASDYLIFSHSYGRDDAVLWADLPPGLQGLVCSFSTCRLGGFTDREIAYLRALSGPLALSLKAITTQDLARTILDTYLGAYSGGQVLDGRVERGDGQQIECVLWYSDMRESTALADRMPLDAFLAMVNDYFECTAGAVLDHGGEVLRFIGDAVIAIFPFEAERRPVADMTRAAVATAREASARIERRNTSRAGSAREPIRFGISLHVGNVMYGNIGTNNRLEFSVIGPAANEVVRLESLCKTLGATLIASEQFASLYPEETIYLGAYPVAGLDRGLAAHTLPDFRPAVGA